MKTIQRLSILTVALLTLASSCNRDEAGLNPSEQQYGTVTITADAARTRTVIDDGGAVKWEDGDEIALRFTHDTEEAVVGKFTTSIEDGPAASADFTGTVALDVLKSDGGYHDEAFAVYPHSALTADGVAFALPAAQQAREDGSFAARLNLTSAALSLADIRDDGKASAAFRNALSILRFSVTGDDVTSVTITGTAPLAGSAPVVFSEDGRLVIDTDAEWKDAAKETSVTLTPADGSECFEEGTVYNLLVWPGTHQSLTATLDFKEYGAFDKTSVNEFTFAASKFYTLDFNADSETLVKEITDPLDAMDLELPGLADRIAALETTAEKISVLLDQIQSVALVSEYLDNAVYLPYAQLSYSIVKKDFKLTFLVRPVAAMRLLLDLCEQEGNLSEVLSACVHDGTGSLTVLTVTDAVLEGDMLTVSVSPLPDSFYTGGSSAAVALQISDGNTSIISDFADLVPRRGAVLGFTLEEVPVLKGTSLEYRFQYGAHDMSAAAVAITDWSGFASAPRITYSGGTGYIHADVSGSSDPSAMSLTVTLTEGEDTDTRTLSFKSVGEFKVETSGEVDYIGGEVAVNVSCPNFSVYSELQAGGSWVYQTNTGNNENLTFDENTDNSPRSASVSYKITNTSYITYTSSVTINQRAYGTALQGSYYSDGDYVLLNQKTASVANALNIVILGDGYRKKDLLKGGKFERSARSAMEAFFGVAPFRDFHDRFNVYMVAYESVEEGLGVGEAADTYFGTWYQGSGSTYVNLTEQDKAINAVQNTLSLSGNAYYRSNVIMLINTSESIGSATYPSQTTTTTDATGDGYASFSIAMIAANTTATSGLVRHEAGGHGFGRLGDEYAVDWYTPTLIEERHGVGFYRNVATNTSYWSAFTSAGYGSDKVTYDAYGNEGLYRSTHESGIMWNNSGTYNAVSRHAIYERIIKQTEGYSAYSWEKFLEYDKKNL